MPDPITRRSALHGLLAGAAFSRLAPRTFAAPGSRSPNIVLLLGDDHGILDAGCYGNTICRTPNMDRLAREGLRFTHAFTSAAMCTPTRSMLYTGLFPHRNGADRNHSAISDGVNTMPLYLQPLGYRVALVGKRHIKPQEAFPFEYLAPNNAPARAVDRFLSDVGREPFCLMVCSNDPHAPYKVPKPGREHDPEKIELPPYLVDTPQTRATMDRYYASVEALDDQLGTYLDLLEKHDLAEDTLFIYTSDNGIGFPFGKWTLYDAGLNMPFIARWPGHIDAGATAAAMIQFVDVLPTCIDLAGGTPPNGLDGRSFLPVLLGKKRRHRDVIFGAHTNLGIISGSEYPIRCIRTRTHKYIVNLNHEGRFENVLTQGRETADRTPDPVWLSWLDKAEADLTAAVRVRLYQHRPARELYDLRTDPFELDNMADDPSNRKRVNNMHRRLRQWMAQQNDPLLPRMSP